MVSGSILCGLAHILKEHWAVPLKADRLRLIRVAWPNCVTRVQSLWSVFCCNLIVHTVLVVLVPCSHCGTSVEPPKVGVTHPPWTWIGLRSIPSEDPCGCVLCTTYVIIKQDVHSSAIKCCWTWLQHATGLLQRC